MSNQETTIPEDPLFRSIMLYANAVNAHVLPSEASTITSTVLPDTEQVIQRYDELHSIATKEIYRGHEDPKTVHRWLVGLCDMGISKFEDEQYRKYSSNREKEVQFAVDSLRTYRKASLHHLDSLALPSVRRSRK